MPVAFDPNAIGTWALKTDRAKPKATRPVFLVKFLTDAQCDEIDRKRDMSDLVGEDGELPAESFWRRWWEVVSSGVIGWRNMPWQQAGLPHNAPFTLDNLKKMLTRDELGELYRGFVEGVTLDEGDVKNSLGQPSPNAQEAQTAVAATPIPAAA